MIYFSVLYKSKWSVVLVGKEIKMKNLFQSIFFRILHLSAFQMWFLCVGCKNNIQSFQQIFFSLFFLVSQIPIKITLNSFWMSWSTILTWVPINNGKKAAYHQKKKIFFYSHFNQRQIRLRRTAFFSLSNISRFKCERE